MKEWSVRSKDRLSGLAAAGACLGLIAASFVAAPGSAEVLCPMIGDELVLQPAGVEPESSVWLQELDLANQTVLALLSDVRVAIRLADPPSTGQ